MKQAFLSSGFFISERCASHDNNFNLLRFIAASLVLVAHSKAISMGHEFHAPFHEVAQGRALGNWAVLIFFAISGFFITRSYDMREDWRAFTSARLFPGLAVALLVTIVVAGLLFTTAPGGIFWSAAPEYFLHNLTMFYPQWSLPGVFPDNPYAPPEYGVALNGSLWTLSFEFLCYIGVLIAGVAGILRRPMLFAVCVLAILGFAILVELHDLRPRLTNLARLGLPFALGASMWIWRRYMFMHWAVALALCVASVVFVKTTASTSCFRSACPMVPSIWDMRALACLVSTVWATTPTTSTSTPFPFSRWSPI